MAGRVFEIFTAMNRYTFKHVASEPSGAAMVSIDGSEGEGGGQILRSALALSALTGVPFEIYNIRAGRKNPGLQAQHLMSVHAAKEISGADVEGASPGSGRIAFRPGRVRGGRYRFSVSTAGSVGLVLQAIYLPLELAQQPSEVVIDGGTHVAWAPTYNYLEEAWLHFMRLIGIEVSLQILKAGFYPHGGGAIEARFAGRASIRPIHLEQRGQLLEIRGYSAHSNLSEEVAHRQVSEAKRLLDLGGLRAKFTTASLSSLSKNTTFALTARFEKTVCCYTALGEKGKRAEEVAAEACLKFFDFLQTKAAVDEYMADQLLLPLAMAQGKSVYTASKITDHLLTNASTVAKFVDVELYIDGEKGKEGLVSIEPRKTV